MEKEKQEKEIINLRATIKANSNKVENLACGSDTYKITGEKWALSVYGSKGGSVFYKAELTWDQIFSSVAPYLVTFKNYSAFKDDLKTGINSAYKSAT